MNNENIIKELRECLEWMISEDDTMDIPNNEYWIGGLERSRKAVAEANGETYEAGDWHNWSGTPQDDI
jgi:hypothetical protein